MQNHTILCPGKVFLLGEYLVLTGGPGLILATLPAFELHSKLPREPRNKIHPDSPAGRLAKNSATAWSWFDPYDSPIGVGSSSAQFLCAAQALGLRQSTNLESILHLYWETVGATQGLRPSGADVACQSEGGLVSFQNSPMSCTKVFLGEETPLEELMRSRFFLVFTGSKAKTHEHLLRLQNTGFPDKTAHVEILIKMRELVDQGTQLLSQMDWVKFGGTLTSYQRLMNELTSSILSAEGRAIAEWSQNICSLPHVLGAKVSGAQGGDCILVMADRQALHSSTEVEDFKNILSASRPTGGHAAVFDVIVSAQGCHAVKL